MKVFRLSRRKYKHKLSGYGASLTGQRWNSKGTEIIYAAESRALATSEVAVHLPLGILPKDYFMVEIDIPTSVKIKVLPTKDLRAGWDSNPSQPGSQVVGDDFVRQGKFAVLKVPSAVVKGDHNFLINPKHADFSKIKVTGTSPFPFDPRLFT